MIFLSPSREDVTHICSFLLCNRKIERLNQDIYNTTVELNIMVRPLLG